MLARHHDPILAVATAPGRGSVGIVRVSGKSLAPLVDRLFGRALRPREATYLPFLDAAGQVIDQGLALYFAAPHSFTGEDVLELQGHGGQVVMQLLLARCLECLPGLRLALPGEFTERAFLNGKMDLAQAEAVADLIDAGTEAAARGAAQSMTGAFSREVRDVRDALIQLRMLVEATLDFPEEEIDFLEQADARGRLARLQQALQVVLGHARQGALLREGLKVVIAGQPNAGKSSLLNALAGAELAIVTPIPGTTRDKVEKTIQIEGVPVHVVDTAGLRRSDDTVEAIGIARAWEAIGVADAVIFLHDLTRAEDPEYLAADANIAKTLAEVLPKSVLVLQVWNKADATHVLPDMAPHDLLLSAKQATGLTALRQALLSAAGWQPAGSGHYVARARHLEALRTVDAHLGHALALLSAAIPALDLMAEELRLAQNALNSITGEFTSDDLLGVIFSNFCIGK